MDEAQKKLFQERFKQLYGFLAAAILDNGGELRVSATRLAEVTAKIEAGVGIEFQFSDDGQSVRVRGTPKGR